MLVTEKQLVANFGEEVVWTVCNEIARTVRGLRASGGVPTGENKYVEQHEMTIKYLMSKNRIPYKVGKWLLENLNERTILAILRIGTSDPNMIGVWLL